MLSGAAGRARHPGLRRANLALAALHLVQGVAVLALSNSFSLPVTGAYLDGPPGVTEPAANDELFGLPVGPLVAVFLLLAALDHLLVALPRGVAWYERNLDRGRNVARWLEYSLSASIMVVLIAMLTGISDLAALLALFGVNVAMILFGWLMETTNEPGRPVRRLPFWFGCVAGIVPWLAIAAQIAGSVADGSGPPGFVYGIFFSLFVLFNSFALNQWLQFAGKGRWREPLHAERVYLLLSLVAKSLLAWQVFANTLVL